MWVAPLFIVSPAAILTNSLSVFNHLSISILLLIRILMQGSSTIEARDMETVSCEETICKNDKVCFDCKTSKTPLWRSGPAGPKSLCNACGIRYRKKRSVVGSSDKKREKLSPPPPPTPTLPPTLPPSPTSTPTPTSSSSSTTACNSIGLKNRRIEEDFEMKNGHLRKKMRIKVVALGKEVRLLQRPRSLMKKVKRRRMEKEYKKFGEVERAAFLLMSLSCGSVFA